MFSISKVFFTHFVKCSPGPQNAAPVGLRPFADPSKALIQPDWFYLLLPPLTGPVTLFTVYLTWLGMKFFRHN